MRQRAKVDANHGIVCEALRKAGWTVISTAAMGKGFPDVLACKKGRMELVEIKGEKGKLTDDQRRFHIDMANCGVTVKLLRTIEDAVRL